MSSRAERRRLEREAAKGEWSAFTPEDHQTLDIRKRVRTHTETCERCRTGRVANKGCRWLNDVFMKDPSFLRAVLNSASQGVEGAEDYAAELEAD